VALDPGKSTEPAAYPRERAIELVQDIIRYEHPVVIPDIRMRIKGLHERLNRIPVSAPEGVAKTIGVSFKRPRGKVIQYVAL